MVWDIMVGDYEEYAQPLKPTARDIPTFIQPLPAPEPNPSCQWDRLFEVLSGLPRPHLVGDSGERSLGGGGPDFEIASGRCNLHQVCRGGENS